MSSGHRPFMISRPACPSADRFELASCGDPACGAHLVAYDADDKPICEIVIGAANIPSFIEALQRLSQIGRPS